MSESKLEIRNIFRNFVGLNWKFGLFLILLICIPRFILVLKANESGSYSVIGMLMFISALIPFVFLNKKGIRSIGIVKSNKYNILLLSFISGLVLSFILYYIGDLLYASSTENFYVYIGNSYNIPEGISMANKRTMFVIMAITGMTFSPIGEELFFRGIVHKSFENSLGNKLASIVDSGVFALVHLSHFGIVYVSGVWKFYPLPSIIWLTSMFVLSLVFIFFKDKSQSIWGAVLCHSGFNLGMIYCIFYMI